MLVHHRCAPKRPYNKQLINLVRSVITGKSQTEALTSASGLAEFILHVHLKNELPDAEFILGDDLAT